MNQSKQPQGQRQQQELHHEQKQLGGSSSPSSTSTDSNAPVTTTTEAKTTTTNRRSKDRRSKSDRKKRRSNNSTATTKHKKHSSHRTKRKNCNNNQRAARVVHNDDVVTSVTNDDEQLKNHHRHQQHQLELAVDALQSTKPTTKTTIAKSSSSKKKKNSKHGIELFNHYNTQLQTDIENNICDDTTNTMTATTTAMLSVPNNQEIMPTTLKHQTVIRQPSNEETTPIQQPGAYRSYSFDSFDEPPSEEEEEEEEERPRQEEQQQQQNHEDVINATQPVVAHCVVANNNKNDYDNEHEDEENDLELGQNVLNNNDCDSNNTTTTATTEQNQQNERQNKNHSSLYNIAACVCIWCCLILTIFFIIFFVAIFSALKDANFDFKNQTNQSNQTKVSIDPTSCTMNSNPITTIGSSVCRDRVRRTYVINPTLTSACNHGDIARRCNGVLASITTQEEYDIVLNLIDTKIGDSSSSSIDPSPKVWLGGTQEYRIQTIHGGEESTFEWLDGSEPIYPHWEVGQPDNLIQNGYGQHSIVLNSNGLLQDETGCSNDPVITPQLPGVYFLFPDYINITSCQQYLPTFLTL